MKGRRMVKIRYGEKTFLLDEDSTISDFLKSQHLDPLKMVVLKKVGDSLVINV
jgi:sulfur carrier protein ThiS